jgi:hypothetical protein
MLIHSSEIERRRQAVANYHSEVSRKKEEEHRQEQERIAEQKRELEERRKQAEDAKKEKERLHFELQKLHQLEQIKRKETENQNAASADKRYFEQRMESARKKFEEEERRAKLEREKSRDYKKGVLDQVVQPYFIICFFTISIFRLKNKLKKKKNDN